MTTNNPPFTNTLTKLCPSCVQRGVNTSHLYVRAQQVRWYFTAIRVQMNVNVPNPYYEYEITQTDTEPQEGDEEFVTLTCEEFCTSDQIETALQEQLDYQVLINNVAAGV